MVTYITVNVLCLVLFLIIYGCKREFNFHDTASRTFEAFLCTSMAIVVLDTVWTLLADRCTQYLLLGWLVNIFYFCMSGFVGLSAIIWLSSEQGGGKLNPVHTILLTIPAVTLTVLSVASYWTGWIFCLDEAGGYHRGPLYWLQVVLAFGPNIIHTIALYIKAAREPHVTKRRKYLILASFALPIYFCQVLQVISPEVPMLNCGLTVGAVWVYVRLQNQLISLDALTGLNNRYQLDNYLFGMLSGSREIKTRNFLCMLDLNNFKAINDQYGHLEGDNALRIAADILKHASDTVHPFLSRYGGDEFVIVIEAENRETVDNYCEALRAMALERSRVLPYEISFSIGIAEFGESRSVQELIAAADRELYKEKQHKP